MPDPARAAGAAPRFLIVRRRYLGDVVLIEPLVRALAQAWPEASVTALVDAPYADVLSLMPDLDHALTLPRRPGLRDWWRLQRTVRRAGFTHVLDLDNRENTALLTRLSGAAQRRTLVLEGLRLKLPFCYTHVAVVPSRIYESRSIVETYFDAMAWPGARPAEYAPRLRPRPAELAWARAFLAECGRREGPARFLLVHPGTRAEPRRWPAELFAQTIERAHSALGLYAILAGGPGDEEAVARIAAACSVPVACAPLPLDLGRWAALAAEAGLVLCHDSGPMHLAAGAGARVVALYGSQNPRVWRPLGAGHALLQPPLPCTDCAMPGVCVPRDSYRNYCTRRIPPETVLDALRTRLLGTVPP